MAGAGVPVAKHGNRALSSRSGAADVLSALGVNIDLSPERIAGCIEQADIGFMFAPAHHPAMKNVGPTRVELGTRTIFNLLGPLSNPASVKRQMVGVFSRHWLEPLAQVLRNLGCEAAWVVHGSDGLDEITTSGLTHVAALETGKVRSFEITPEEWGRESQTGGIARRDGGRECAPSEGGAQRRKMSVPRYRGSQCSRRLDSGGARKRSETGGGACPALDRLRRSPRTA